MNRLRPDESHLESDERWAFLRDVIVFQLKLLLDAVRDVVLSPISIAAGLADLVTGGDRPGRYFYRVLAVGRSSDGWINLFGESEPGATRAIASRETPTVDSLVNHVERLIVEQYERGGVTASAKEAIDRSLNTIGRKREHRQSDDEAGGFDS